MKFFDFFSNISRVGVGNEYLGCEHFSGDVLQLDEIIIERNGIFGVETVPTVLIFLKSDSSMFFQSIPLIAVKTCELVD